MGIGETLKNKQTNKQPKTKQKTNKKTLSFYLNRTHKKLDSFYIIF